MYLMHVPDGSGATAFTIVGSSPEALVTVNGGRATTHPIAGEVPDTEHTFLNFDGITYGKGAAVIKQLVAAMGMEGFREGMRRYFKRHEFSNTTLSQFLDALSEGVGRDLHPPHMRFLGNGAQFLFCIIIETDLLIGEEFKLG